MTEDDLLMLMVQAEDQYPDVAGLVLRRPGEWPMLHLGDQQLQLAAVRPLLYGLLRHWYIAPTWEQEAYRVAEAGREHYRTLTAMGQDTSSSGLVCVSSSEADPP